MATKKAAKEDRPVYLPGLQFDSSGSAMVRFFDKLAEISVHWADAPIQQYKLACPEGKCKACPHVPSMPRRIAIGWDVSRGRWCVYMAHKNVFSQAFKLCRKQGVTPADMETGNGPDVLLQRMGMKTMVSIIPETLDDEPPRTPPPPSLKAVIAGLYKKSIWNYLSSVQEAKDHFPAKDYSPLVFPSDKSMKATGPNKQAEPSEEEKPGPDDPNLIDGSALFGNDRWDLC